MIFNHYEADLVVSFDHTFFDSYVRGNPELVAKAVSKVKDAIMGLPAHVNGFPQGVLADNIWRHENAGNIQLANMVQDMQRRHEVDSTKQRYVKGYTLVIANPASFYAHLLQQSTLDREIIITAMANFFLRQVGCVEEWNMRHQFKGVVFQPAVGKENVEFNQYYGWQVFSIQMGNKGYQFMPSMTGGMLQRERGSAIESHS